MLDCVTFIVISILFILSKTSLNISIIEAFLIPLLIRLLVWVFKEVSLEYKKIQLKKAIYSISMKKGEKDIFNAMNDIFNKKDYENPFNMDDGG